MEIQTLSFDNFPPLLKEIETPPQQLFIRGSLPKNNPFYLAVVGSRKYTNYGKEAAEHLIQGLEGYDVAIVSGLALGIDAIAHRAALRYNLPTIAIPGSGLDPKHIYPRSHKGLSEEILKQNGALLSPFEPDAEIYPSNFPQRNGIMAGMSHATLVIEATEKSGTLITARLALESDRDVFAVPGSIFSPSSVGPNKLIADGATPIHSAEDIVFALGLTKQKKRGNAPQAKILGAHFTFPLKKDVFFSHFETVHEAQTMLTKLELEGQIYVEGDTLYSKN